MREVFTFRLLAGVAFALIFYYRSLAHAVYAHALYDVWVLVVVAAHSSP
jgi:membrane protease YdiL (CAAX protease family)